jgi:predicted signal transduction protein with EAL and GGDEF domain/DNA-binding response OmpR family regulator
VTPGPARILVADDDPVARLVVAAALGADAHTVLEVADGIAAVATFESERPDCVILDVIMPGLDGFNACRKIRSLPHGSDVPILILTSHDDPASVSHAYAAGATDFLSKTSGPRLITERVRFLMRAHNARRELVVSQRRLRAVQAMARIGHWELDREGNTVDLSGTVRDILGGADGGTPGIGSLLSALGNDHRKALVDCVARWRDCGEPFRLDARLGDGIHLHIQGASTPAAHASNGDSLTLAIQDVTLLRSAQEEARRLTLFDTLTGLPNRKRFTEVLDVAISGRPASSAMAVLAIRLQGHERVLESAGQDACDQVLVAATARLEAAGCTDASSGRILAHLEGGDFALALPDCASPASAAMVAERLLKALRAPVSAGTWTVSLLTQVGIAMWPQDELAGAALLAGAQATAARRSPETGAGYGFFTPEVLSRARRRMQVEAALRDALAAGQLSVVFQPRVEMDGLHIAGAETLLRWSHPELGEVSPLEFVPVAEEAGLIVDIGHWVMEQACYHAQRWRRTYNRAVAVSVNVSAQQLAEPRQLIASVRDSLERSGLPAYSLELELTESMIIHAEAPVLRALEEIRRLGVSIALDDFGTGYSSLSYLRKLPVDCLKIDRSFVADLIDDSSAEGVLSAILSIARTLRLRTVAEGIETDAQYRMLLGHGCREGQGYLFSRPLAPGDFQALLANPSLASLAASLAGAA